MSLGASLWSGCKKYYDGLILARDGIQTEQEFASRLDLATAFPQYEQFWKRHVCPATNRPHDANFRSCMSPIVCRIAQVGHSILERLLDAADSLAKVLAGDLGHRQRNGRDAIEAAGNALQLLTELQYAIAGNKKDASVPNLAAELKVPLKPFPDWKAFWGKTREELILYRNYLVHSGGMYTVHDGRTGETLVLGRVAFSAEPNWLQAQQLYHRNPTDWRPLTQVSQEQFHETVAFADLTYERLIESMDPLLTNPDYQKLWGWDGVNPLAAPASPSPTTLNSEPSVSITQTSGTTIISPPVILTGKTKHIHVDVSRSTGRHG